MDQKREMEDLTKKHCVPCEAKSGIEPFNAEQANEYLKEVPGWELADDQKSIGRSFKFANFAEALEFVTKIGQVAEEEGHHPDIEFGWGYAKIKIATHAIGGLSENDFILAAKINRLQAK